MTTSCCILSNNELQSYKINEGSRCSTGRVSCSLIVGLAIWSSAPSVNKCPSPRCWTPNCSCWLDWCLAWCLAAAGLSVCVVNSLPMHHMCLWPFEMRRCPLIMEKSWHEGASQIVLLNSCLGSHPYGNLVPCFCDVHWVELIHLKKKKSTKPVAPKDCVHPRTPNNHNPPLP